MHILFFFFFVNIRVLNEVLGKAAMIKGKKLQSKILIFGIYEYKLYIKAELNLNISIQHTVSLNKSFILRSN